MIIEQLSPETFDVEGVVDALQKKHPFHLGPSLVSANQVCVRVSTFFIDYARREQSIVCIDRDNRLTNENTSVIAGNGTQNSVLGQQNHRGDRLSRE